MAVPFPVALALVTARTALSHTDAALFLVVVAVAALGGRTAGAIAALPAAAWSDFFLTRPYQTFDITASADTAKTAPLLAVGLTVHQLAARVRKLHIITLADAAYPARIHRTADLVRSVHWADTVVGHVRTELTELLGLRACRFEYGTPGTRNPDTDDRTGAAPDTSGPVRGWWGRGRADPSTSRQSRHVEREEGDRRGRRGRGSGQTLGALARPRPGARPNR
ncbi:DUF4118 domain-containing protein [Streptomyces sp. SID6139]|uniref:DUF4118 domain-containing protein n=1 Tax=Streptomyces sp. SID6139 TaxID=2690320 RepID=UPI001369AFD2|nr:DUF4118 domain-containing protein [Streptomyces sp. SID6139]MYR22351.1 DUF4118 domain-containing protein [Streptomyces sp. SID6137]